MTMVVGLPRQDGSVEVSGDGGNVTSSGTGGGGGNSYECIQ